MNELENFKALWYPVNLVLDLENHQTVNGDDSLKMSPTVSAPIRYLLGEEAGG